MDTMIAVNIIRRAGVCIAGLGAAALILAACSSGGGRPAASGGSARTPLPPRQAVLAAATQTRQVTSATELVTMRARGTVSETITGTIRVQLKPVRRLAATLNFAEPGKHAQVKEILTGTAFYLSGTALNRQTGKPWAKIGLAALTGPAAVAVDHLVHSLQSSSFDNQVAMLTLAKDVRVVGTQTVGGVSTTEYACSLNAVEALKALNPGVLKALAPELRALGNTTISYRVWIDGQNDIRKMTGFVSARGETGSTTVDITALNQPVHITPPPASQTATRPGGPRLQYAGASGAGTHSIEGAR
jgi:hypothetical protein